VHIFKVWSENGYGFLMPGLKTGVENGIFWSEIGYGFADAGGTPPQKIPRSSPPGCNITSQISLNAQAELLALMIKKQQVTILAEDNHTILKQQQLLKSCVQTSQKVPRPTEAMLSEPDLDPGRRLRQHRILFSKQVVFSLLCRLSFLSYRKCYVK